MEQKLIEEAKRRIRIMPPNELSNNNNNETTKHSVWRLRRQRTNLEQKFNRYRRSPRLFNFTFLLWLMTWCCCCSYVDASCTLCRDGSEILKPDKVVTMGQIIMKCKDMTGYIPIYGGDEGSPACQGLQQLGTVCGCKKREDACDLCIDGSSVGDPKHRLPDYDKLLSFSPMNCDLMEAYTHDISKNTRLCRRYQNELTERCVCSQRAKNYLQASNMAMFAISETVNTTMLNITENDAEDRELPGEFNLLVSALFGAETEEEVKRQHTVFRSAAALSILGTLLVILDNFFAWRQGDRSTTKNSGNSLTLYTSNGTPRKTNYCCWYFTMKKLQKNNYNQIIVAMALVDLVLSVSTIFMNAPKPKADQLFSEQGAYGNDTTCMIQGLTRQFGSITSLAFNATLSTYYVMIIVFNSKKSRLRSLQSWFLGIPLFLGVVLTSASIPFIEPALVGCHIIPPFSTSSFITYEGADEDVKVLPFFLLYMIPAFGVMAYATVSMVVVGIYIHRVENKSKKYDFARSVRHKNANSRNVYFANNSGVLNRTHMNPMNASINSVNSSFKSSIRTNPNFNNSITMGNLQQQLQGLEEKPLNDQNLSTTHSVFSNHTRTSHNTGVSSSTRHRQTHAKNSLKGKVMFQCSLYLIAMFLSWVPYLTLTLKIKANKDILQHNYVIWTFAMFLLPLQGFLNAVVYFKRRMARFIYTCYRMIQEIREERMEKKNYERFLEYYETAKIDGQKEQKRTLGRSAACPTSITSACTGNTTASQRKVLYPSSGPSSTSSSSEINDVQHASTSPETDTDGLADTDGQPTLTPRINNKIIYKMNEDNDFDKNEDDECINDEIEGSNELKKVEEDEVVDITEMKRSLIDDDCMDFLPPPLPHFARHISPFSTTITTTSLSPHSSPRSEKGLTDDYADAFPGPRTINRENVVEAEKPRRRAKPLVSTPGVIPQQDTLAIPRKLSRETTNIPRKLSRETTKEDQSLVKTRRRERRRKRQARNRRPSMARFNEPTEDLIDMYGNSSSSSSDSEEEKKSSQRRHSLVLSKNLRKNPSFKVKSSTKTSLIANRSNFSYFLTGRSPEKESTNASTSAAAAVLDNNDNNDHLLGNIEEGEIMSFDQFRQHQGRERRYVPYLENFTEPTEQLLDLIGEEDEDDDDNYNRKSECSQNSTPVDPSHASAAPPTLTTSNTTFSYFMGRHRVKEEDQQKRTQLRRRSNEGIMQQQQQPQSRTVYMRSQTQEQQKIRKKRYSDLIGDDSDSSQNSMPNVADVSTLPTLSHHATFSHFMGRQNGEKLQQQRKRSMIPQRKTNHRRNQMKPNAFESSNINDDSSDCSQDRKPKAFTAKSSLPPILAKTKTTFSYFLPSPLRGGGAEGGGRQKYARRGSQPRSSMLDDAMNQEPL